MYEIITISCRAFQHNMTLTQADKSLLSLAWMPMEGHLANKTA